MDKPIQHIRLINGEEIISRVIESNDNGVVCENPLIVEDLDDSTGMGSKKVLANYIKFTGISNPTCTFNKMHVISITPVHPEVERYYQNSLIFSDDYDRDFVDSLKKANEHMEAYVQDLQIPYMDEEDDYDFESLTNSFSSNTVH